MGTGDGLAGISVCLFASGLQWQGTRPSSLPVQRVAGYHSRTVEMQSTEEHLQTVCSAPVGGGEETRMLGPSTPPSHPQARDHTIICSHCNFDFEAL